MGGHAGIWYGVPLFGTDGANGAPIALRFRQVFFAASDLTVDPWNLLPGTISSHFARRELPNNYLWPCLACLVFIITVASSELVEDPPPVTRLNFNFLLTTPSSKELICLVDWSKTVGGEHAENIVHELSSPYESGSLP